MYQRVVVPLDGSPFAEEALPHATQLANLLTAPLHLVRVVDLSHVQGYGPFGMAIESFSLEELGAEEHESARAYLAQQERDLAGHGATVTTELRQGMVARELLAIITQEDVVVMASHGRSGVTRWFLGSVAEDLVRRSPVPVLLIPARATAHGTEERP